MDVPQCRHCHFPLAFNGLCPNCGTGNWMCHFSRCAQPVAYFCLCSDPSILSCEEHRRDHLITPNPDCMFSPIQAMPVLRQLGPREFRKDLENARLMSAKISREVARLDAHQISFDAALEEVKRRVTSLQYYSLELERKRATLREAQQQMSAEFYCKPTSGILTQLGVVDNQLPELPLLSFDREYALQDLELRTVAENWALEKLNWAVTVLQTPQFHEASLCWLDDDKAFVTGGDGSKSAWLLTRRATKQVRDMTHERMSHGTVRYQDRVYVFGGSIGVGSHVKSWERYSLTSNTWDSQGNMREERCFFTPGLYQGKIYLAGGLKNSIEVFDPVSEHFTLLVKKLPTMCGGLVLTLSDQLLVLFDNGIYRFGPQPGFVKKEHGVCVLMHSFSTPLYMDQTAYLLTPLNDKSPTPHLVKLMIKLKDSAVTVTECD